MQGYRGTKGSCIYGKTAAHYGPGLPKMSRNTVNVIDFDLFGFNVSIWVGPLKSLLFVPKSHDKLVELFTFTRYICGKNQGAFCSISMILLKSLLRVSDLSDDIYDCDFYTKNEQTF